MKKLIAALLLWSFSASAGLPPTTIQGQSDATPKTKFSFQTPYYQSTDLGGIKTLIETGSTNVLQDPGVEATTIKWKPYNDTDASDLTKPGGASPMANITGAVITCNQDKTLPISGTASLLITKSAANDQGMGCSLNFSIDRAMQGKVITVSFDYEMVTGTYDAGSDTTDPDLGVYLYGPSDATPLVIQPAPYKLLGVPLGSTVQHFQTTFQTATTGVNYTLGFHEIKTGTVSYGVRVDNFVVSPVVRLYGSPVTDWVSYTPPTAGLGTVSFTEAFYARVGDSIYLKGRVSLGTTTATTASIGFPSGLSVDVAKEASTSVVGGTVTNHSAATVFSPLVAGNDTAIYFGNVTAPGGLGKIGGTTLGSSGNAVGYAVGPIPITGWSSSVQMSNDADTRVVAARVTLSTDPAVTINTPIPFNATVFDTHGAVTLGASFKFTCPVPGYYEVKINGGSGSSFQWRIWKNGSVIDNFGINDTATARGSGTTLVQCNAGDYLDIRPDGTVTLTGGSSVNWATFQKLSGPSAIAASESVNASYYLSANSAATHIPFDTKIYDSHNAVTTGASFVFTAPVAGVYSVSYNMLGGGTGSIQLIKNAATYNLMGGVLATTTSAATTVKLLAGDTIYLSNANSVTITGGTPSAGNGAVISITRVGN